MLNSPISRQRGLSLIELMISVLLGALILAGTVSIFQQSRQSSAQDEQVARMQENGRFALRFLSRELTMMGFWDGILSPGSITTGDVTAGITTDCNANWVLDLTPAIEVNDNVAAAATPYTCITAADIADETDVLSIKRAADDPALEVDAGGNATGAVDTGTIYLKTNSVVAALYDSSNSGSGAAADDGPAAVPDPNSISQYHVYIFYVRPWSVTAGDGIPTLVRESLIDNVMTTQPIVEGIENLQLEFGIDGTDNDLAADYHTAAPTAAELINAVSARIYVLVRSINPVSGYTNAKAYNLGSEVVSVANDNFYRRVYAATAQLRNADKLKLYGLN